MEVGWRRPTSILLTVFDRKMRKKNYILFFLTAITTVAVVFAEESKPVASRLVKTPEYAGITIDTNKIVDSSVELKKSVGRSSNRIRDEKRIRRQGCTRNDVCLNYDGEKLTWGEVEDYVDLQLIDSPLNIPPQATVSEVNTIIANSKLRLEEIAINNFLKEALLAGKAKKSGITISSEELDAALKKATAKTAKKEHADEIVPKLTAKGGYFARLQENYLLTRKYREKAIAPNIKVTPEEISQQIEQRREENEAAAATNAFLKTKIEDLYSKIKSGKIDFGQAAFEHSDCGSCMENGDWGIFNADNCNLLEPLKNFIFAPSNEVMSEVVETPYSYHIIKILERFYDSEDEKSSNATDGEQVQSRSILFILVSCAVAAIALSFLAVLLLRLKRTKVRIVVVCLVLSSVLIVAAILDSILARGAAAADARSPSRVHVQHIMLEKAELKPELDEQSAAQEVRDKKLGRATFMAQLSALDAARKAGVLDCDVKITLLNKAKLLKKKEEKK